MGTNYYLHLGKRSSQGKGKPARFYAAVPNADAGNIRAVTVIDEYGREMTHQEFGALIACDDIDESTIGQSFS